MISKRILDAAERHTNQSDFGSHGTDTMCSRATWRISSLHQNPELRSMLLAIWLDARIRPANLLSELGRRPWSSNPLGNLETHKKINSASPRSGSYNIHVRCDNDERSYIGITSEEFKNRFYQHDFQIGLGIREIAGRRKVSEDNAAGALHIH